ncbi:MAG TPA: hypothetical protein DDY49_13015 [Paenibacillaceae bacterium]|nr:hypothetical protein [Paenibacillaceae bacterium]
MSRRTSTIVFIVLVIIIFFLLSRQLDFPGLAQKVMSGEFLTVQFLYTATFTSFVVIGVFVVLYIIRKM